MTPDEIHAKRAEMINATVAAIGNELTNPEDFAKGAAHLVGIGVMCLSEIAVALAKLAARDEEAFNKAVVEAVAARTVTETKESITRNYFGKPKNPA